MKPAAPDISLSGVHLDFEGRPLFRGLDLTVPAGRTTCILGPSGCGKSTLLKLMAGSPDLPFRGKIRLGGHPSPTGLVAWMSQKDLLLPWLTLLDNVLLGARLRGELSAERKAEALELVCEAGLTGRESSLPSALSGGMRQRAALLRTLMEDRPVILMDEPFSALDALTRVRLQNLAARLTAGCTVVLVTHDPMEALRLGHRVVVLGGHPAQVLETVEPAGAPPREAGSRELTDLYAGLLDRIMRTEAA